MRTRLRRGTSSHNFIPRSKVAKQASSDEGKYTLYALLTCAIIGMVLGRFLPRLIPVLNPTISPDGASDVANLIAFAISAVVLVLLLLKMKIIMKVVVSSYEERRLKTFNERRESNRTDG